MAPARLFIPHYYLFTNNFESLNDARDRGTFLLEFDHISLQFSLGNPMPNTRMRGGRWANALLPFAVFVFNLCPTNSVGTWCPTPGSSESREREIKLVQCPPLRFLSASSLSRESPSCYLSISLSFLPIVHSLPTLSLNSVLEHSETVVAPLSACVIRLL